MPRNLYVGDTTDIQDSFTTNSQHKVVFNLIDYGSRFVWCFPIVSKTASEIVRCLELVL